MPYNLPLLLLPLLGGFVFTKNWYRTYEGKASTLRTRGLSDSYVVYTN